MTTWAWMALGPNGSWATQIPHGQNIQIGRKVLLDAEQRIIYIRCSASSSTLRPIGIFWPQGIWVAQGPLGPRAIQARVVKMSNWA